MRLATDTSPSQDGCRRVPGPRRSQVRGLASRLSTTAAASAAYERGPGVGRDHGREELYVHDTSSLPCACSTTQAACASRAASSPELMLCEPRLSAPWRLSDSRATKGASTYPREHKTVSTGHRHPTPTPNVPPRATRPDDRAKCPRLPIQRPPPVHLRAPLILGLAIAPAWMPDVSSMRRYVPFAISTLIADSTGAAKPLFLAVANP